MTLQAEQIHIAYSEHVRIGPSVRNMAGTAPLDLYRLMLENEGPLLIDMTFETDSILRRRSPHLLWPHGSVWVMAVTALDQAFIHTMVKGHRKLGLLLQMAGVAELWLGFHQQVLFRFRVVRGVAVDTAHAVLGVDRVDAIHMLGAARMASQTAVADGFC